MTSRLRPLTGVSSLSSLAVSPDQDSSDDYPKIEISTCGDSAREGRLIFMVASNGDPSHHSSSRYPTIGMSEASNARTPNAGMIRNLNPDFNVVWFQTIMESIQRMAPEGSPLMALAQQGAEVANLVVAERLVGNPQREPSVTDLLIGRGKPEVKQHLWLAVIVIWPTTTHVDASPRTATCGSTAVTDTTSAMSLKIRGTLGQGPCLLHVGL
jgi:hypothetical protein